MVKILSVSSKETVLKPEKVLFIFRMSIIFLGHSVMPYNNLLRSEKYWAENREKGGTKEIGIPNK